MPISDSIYSYKPGCSDIEFEISEDVILFPCHLLKMLVLNRSFMYKKLASAHNGN